MLYSSKNVQFRTTFLNNIFKLLECDAHVEYDDIPQQLGKDDGQCGLTIVMRMSTKYLTIPCAPSAYPLG